MQRGFLDKMNLCMFSYPLPFQHKLLSYCDIDSISYLELFYRLSCSTVTPWHGVSNEVEPYTVYLNLLLDYIY